MKILFLTSEQAMQLGCDLQEYTNMKDSEDREIFKGFKILFNDAFELNIQPDQSFKILPMPHFVEIDVIENDY
jgi:hypothetical protein